eukprot:gb/GFBE01008060.1/.p1 GENE.gb/GFBE01008060.1/~~gb/GFBE01008060.1/.p1  ORF type:complete len:676 (+),score=239.55 gb/GFBE01008060.1/:1-2028(+)
MKMAGRALRVAALVGTIGFHAVDGSTHGATPVAKAVQMLQAMQDKGIEDMKAEEVRFSAFKQWCQSKASHKQNEIDEGEDKKEQLQSAVEKAESDLVDLQNDIDRENNKIAEYEEKLKAASDERSKELQEYETSNKDLTESLTALDNAISVLKEQADKKVVGDSLLQVQSQGLIPVDQKMVITDFLQAPGDRNAYEGESGGVVEMLAKLKAEFSQQLDDLSAEETKAKQAHELVVNQLKNQNNTASMAIDKSLAAKSQTEQTRSESQADLADATSELEEDKTYLADMETMCVMKADDFEKRKVIREKELTAISTAVKVLQEKVAVLAQISQTASGSALAFLRSGFRSRSQRAHDLQASLVQFLQQRGSSLNSVALAMLSERAAADPLENVKGMIKDMIFKLQQQLTAETDKKGFCDSELGVNKVTRQTKTEDAENLKNDIDDLTAQVGQLAEDIKNLKAALVELDENIEQTSAEREESKAKNLQSVKDAEQAQAAVDEAIVALREFYGYEGGSGSSSLLQTANSDASGLEGPAADAPETFTDPSYAGMDQGGVIEMLEVAETQYASMKAETEEAERKEEGDFQAFLLESEKEKALKTNEQRHKEDKKLRKEQDVKQKNDELAETLDQLEKANAYFEKLKPQCIGTPMSYEERKAKRQEEMAALNEALDLLSEEAV